MKKIISCLVVAFGVVTSFKAEAKDNWEYIPYIGVDYINSDVDYKTSKGVDYSTHHNSGAFELGTTMGNYFGTELFVQKSDVYKKESTHDKHFFNAYGLDMIGYLPIGCDKKFKLLGSFGLGEYHMRSKNRDLGMKKYTDHGFGWRTGVGMQYDIDNKWAVRAMARHVNFDEIHAADHMMEYSAGVRYYLN